MPLRHPPAHRPQGRGALVQAVLLELGLGATLGLGIHLAFAVFSVAGRLLDVQIGFGLGQVIDPAGMAVVRSQARGKGPTG